MKWILEIMNTIIENVVEEAKTHGLRLTVVACSSFLGLITFVTLSLGFLPAVFSGFARADQLSLQGRALDFIQLQLIEQSIRAAIHTRCTTEDKQFYAQLSTDINDLERKYYNISKRDGDAQGFRQPTCQEVD